MIKIGCTYKTLIVFLMCCIHRGFLDKAGGWLTLSDLDKQNAAASVHFLMKMRESKSNNLYLNGESSVHMQNRSSAMGSGNHAIDVNYRQQKIAKRLFHRKRSRRSTDIISSSRLLDGVFSSTQRSDIQNVRIKQTAPQFDTKEINVTKSDVKPVTGEQDMKLTDLTYQQQNISTSINMTLFNIYAKTLRRRRDARSATLCLSAVVILLIAVVLYSRMWQRRTHWRTLDDVLDEQHARSELPQHGKVSLQDLLERKLSIIMTQFRKLSSKYHDSPQRGQYKELIKREISETEIVYS